MCGIAGYNLGTHENIDESSLAVMMAILQAGNDGRGGDSWGYMYAKINGQFEVVRGLGDIIKVPSKELARHNTLMIHTRKATTGGISIANAHPFDVGDIVGAHNGMVSNHTELNRENHRTCEVDSMHIFHHINEGKTLGDIEGYGAIEYINKKNPNKVFLCKLRSGQLSVYGLGSDRKEGAGIIWSSDDTHIEKAVAAAGLKAFSYKIEEGVLYFVEDGRLFKSNQKLAFKERNYTTNDFRSTGYTGPVGRTGRNYDYEDDDEFMKYLGDKYGSAPISGSAQTGDNKSPKLLPATGTQTIQSDTSTTLDQRSVEIGLTADSADEGVEIPILDEDDKVEEVQASSTVTQTIVRR